jgi:hypothetical protein
VPATTPDATPIARSPARAFGAPAPPLRPSVRSRITARARVPPSLARLSDLYAACHATGATLAARPAWLRAHDATLAVAGTATAGEASRRAPGLGTRETQVRRVAFPGAGGRGPVVLFLLRGKGKQLDRAGKAKGQTRSGRISRITFLGLCGHHRLLRVGLVCGAGAGAKAPCLPRPNSEDPSMERPDLTCHAPMAMAMWDRVPVPLRLASQRTTLLLSRFCLVPKYFTPSVRKNMQF